MHFLLTAGFIALDMVTGVVKAFKKKAFTSSIMREGLFHKVGSVAFIGFGVLIDYAQSYIDIGVNIPVTIAICSYIAVMEMGSIVENIGEINPDIVPEKVKPFFAKLSDKE